MVQPDHQAENFAASHLQAAEDLLTAMTESIEGIEKLRYHLITNLSQDVDQLQTQKAQLIDEIHKLQIQYQQQIEQQQTLVREITPELANQLQELLTQRLNQLANSLPISEPEEPNSAIDSNSLANFTPTSIGSKYHENAYRLIASLDTTLRTTFRALQQDLSSYQSSISAQLNQMYNLEQQAEAILETLVKRLKAEIIAESAIVSQPDLPISEINTYTKNDDYIAVTDDTSEQSLQVATPEPPAEVNDNLENELNTAIVDDSSEESISQVTPAPKLEAAPTISPTLSPGKPLVGLLLVLLSLLALGLENIIVHVIFNPSPITGISTEIGGLLAPTISTALLVLWLRMLVLVPLMGILATYLYPRVWRDVGRYLGLSFGRWQSQSPDWSLWANLLSSGFWLFLSKLLIFLALGLISPGVAVTVFFLYPVILLIFSDRSLGGGEANRTHRWQSFITFSSVIFGFVLTTLPHSNSPEFAQLGITLAAGSGITFAIHLMVMQTSAKQLHPIPILWINLVVVLLFSAISLLLPWSGAWSLAIAPPILPSLIISGLALGATTLLSYLFNYIGIAKIGAANASVVGATLPPLTALLALVLIQSSLEITEILGMVFVSLGVAALSFERSRSLSGKHR